MNPGPAIDATTREVEALVLAVRAYGESDKVVELFSADEGRVTVLARGGRASKRRQLGAVDVFAHLRVWLRPLRTSTLLTEAQVLEIHLPLRQDFWRLEWAARLTNLVRQGCPEGQAMPEAFLALKTAWGSLARDEASGLVPGLLALLGALGIAPDLEFCSVCGDVEAPTVALSPTRGGLVCAGCVAQEGLRLSAAEVKILRGDLAEERAVAEAVAQLLVLYAQRCGEAGHVGALGGAGQRASSR